MSTSSGDPVAGLVDHLFRRKSGEMVAALTASFGPERLDLVEEVVQDAMVAALSVWPFRGVPENPGGWLYRTARNRALDRLRRERTATARAAGVEPGPRAADPIRPAVEDEPLRLVFLCCAPEIPREAGLALTLKLAGGFSVEEIARALLAEPSAIAQRIVRAKKTIREHGLAMELPHGAAALRERLGAVLEVLYLMFNEGYSASGGEEVLRNDVAAEAIRLAEGLVGAPATDRPPARALLALMLFHASRFPARRGPQGDLVLLAHQDRARWDRAMLARAFRELDRSLGGADLTRFHVEAAIAAVHAAAPSFEATDWERLLELYDQLLAIAPSPVAELNRSVALARVRGPAAAIDALVSLADDRRLRRYPHLPALLADYWMDLDRNETAAAYLEGALRLPMSEPERRLLERKLEICRRPRVT